MSSGISIQSLMSNVLEMVVTILNKVPDLTDGVRKHSDALIDLVGGALMALSDVGAELMDSLMSIVAPILELGGAVVNVTSNSTVDVSEMINTSDIANISTASVGSEGTPNWAYHSFMDALSANMSRIVGPSDGTSGLTYILNGTTYVVESDGETYNYIGSQLVYSLFSALSEIINLLADFMAKLPDIFTWAP